MEIVSVIIPTYKRSESLFNAIDSVYNQTYKNIEIIVVIDGHDIQIEKKLAEKKYPDLKILTYQRNKGANFARNFGAKTAIGKYLAFLDDDDTWKKTKIEKQIELMKRNDEVGLVYSGRQIHYPDYKVSYYVQPKCKGDLKDYIIKSNCIGSTSTPLIKKNIFFDVGGFDNKFPARQDYDLWIRICQVTIVDYIDEPLVNYYNYAHSNQISDNIDRVKKATELIKQKYCYLLEKFSKKEKEQWEINNLKNYAKRYLRSENNKKARKLYIEIFKKEKSLKNFILLCSTFTSYKNLLKIRACTK